MSDPPRLVSPESPASEFERRILGAWADERPAPTARDGALAALGLGPPGATALAMTKLAKWTLLLLGVSAPVVVAIGRAHSQAAAPVARVEAVSRAEPRAPAIEVRPTPQLVSHAGRPAVRTQPRASRLVDTLPAEISALDRARAALRDDDPTTARALMDAYDAAFPRGVLREEAMVVRIEALVAAGDTDEARRRTDAFAASHPNSPHVARLRRLLREP